MTTEWKTRMLNNKLHIKKSFGFSNKVKLSDEECSQRVKYIMHKMNESGYETKCYFRDLMEYRTNELKGRPFDNADYIAYTSLPTYPLKIVGDSI